MENKGKEYKDVIHLFMFFLFLLMLLHLSCVTDANLGCKEDSDCKTFSKREICCLGKCLEIGKCILSISKEIDCHNDSDCGRGKVCVSGACLDGNCHSNTDCEKGKVCKQYRCTVCSGDKECGKGMVCVSGKCVQGNCHINLDCPKGQLCKSNRCSPCLTDRECGIDKVCISGSCVVGNCHTNADCSGGKVCKKYRCSSCIKNRDCGPGEICQEGRCYLICKSNLDCGPGEICQEGRCYLICKSNLDCGPEEVCFGGVCTTTPWLPQEVLIKAGTFTMGSSPNEPGRDNDEEQHQVKLRRDFWMWKHEVTQGEFKKYMGYNPSHFSSCGLNCPVEKVTWHEAAAFANALSREKGLPECFSCTGSGKNVNCKVKTQYSESKYYDCKGWRLPTEAEWEYAYRAGTTTAFYNGKITNPGGKDPNLEQIGWYWHNSEGKTHPVEQKSPNVWGLYDMAGNVWEWVYDWYGNYPSDTVIDPVGPSRGFNRVNRGGSWSSDARYCRAADRVRDNPNVRSRNLGFRLARSK